MHNSRWSLPNKVNGIFVDFFLSLTALYGHFFFALLIFCLYIRFLILCLHEMCVFNVIFLCFIYFRSFLTLTDCFLKRAWSPKGGEVERI